MNKGIIYMDNRQDLYDVSSQTLEFLEDVIEKTLELEEIPPPWEVSVSIVDPREIQSLNKEYRGVDRTTDVLSFPMEELLPDGTKVLGDVIINMDRVLTQAKEFGHSEERELSYLTVHSILHLLGYDHEEEEEKGEMRMREKEIMNALGIYREEVL